jgi:tetratricopeptide (TPR) repeat protein
MLNNMSRIRKIVFVIVVVILVVVIVILTASDFLGDKSFLGLNVKTGLSTGTILGLTLLQVIPSLQDILRTEKNLSDEDVSNALSELAQADTLLKQKEFKKAMDKATIVIGILPKKAEAYFTRAQAHVALGQLISAIEDYSKVVELEPGHIFARIYRAIVYRDMGEHKNAIEDWEMGLLLSPESIGQIFQLALSCFDVGEFEKAHQRFQEVLDHPETSDREKKMAGEFVVRAKNVLDNATNQSE